MGGRFRDVVFVKVARGFTVSRATRISDGAPVFLKQASTDTARALHRELEILRSIRSPHVCEALELQVHNAATTLVLEGGAIPLQQELAQAVRVPVAAAVRVALEIARALVCVHAAGYVHQNLGPHTIVRKLGTGHMQLVSYDLAARIGDMASPEVVGSLGYLAPEQTGRIGRPLDGRSDLYSLGATLFELLSGQRLFEGADAPSLVHAHLAITPRRIETLVPQVPTVIGNIIAKLLAKAPDQRYQTAHALVADLERCEVALAAGETVPPFEIATGDARAKFTFPDRLYGRAHEVATITDAFASLAHGGVETVLVAGRGGVGKSSVVREAQHLIVLAGGRFVAGKFEQLHRDIPFSAVLVALGDLVAQVLTDPMLDKLRTPLAEALGETAGQVGAQVPALAFILGPPPAPDEVSPDVAQRLLGEGLVRLVQFFARCPRPLALFLDDVQWADAGSLALIKRLVTTDAAEALLVIGAYRDDEVDIAHPFSVAIADYERDGATLVRLEIEALGVDDTAALIADTLQAAPAEVARLAPLVQHKTEGNAFYIKQFLSTLHEEGHLQFDEMTGSLRIDDAALAEASVTDNVAHLLARKIGKLPASTRDALAGAAALGTTFEVAMLASVLAQPRLELQTSLAAAQIAGMITHTPSASAFDRYTFAHDRLQKAAYTALDESARERLHLAIGRHLASMPEAPLFDVVHHLNQGKALLAAGAEQQQFIARASEAAQKARRAGAFDVALTMAASAASLCDREDEPWTWFECTLKYAELLAHAGQPREARLVLGEMRAHVTGSQLAVLDTLDTTACLSLGLMTDALACGLRAAALLGIDLPSDAEARTRLLDRLVAEIHAAAEALPVERWIERPAMDDPHSLAQMGLLMAMIPAAYQGDPPMFALITATMTCLSLRHGNCGISARGFAAFAIELWNRHEFDLAFRLGCLGVALVRHVDAKDILPSVDFTHAMFASPWRRPLVETIDRLTATVASGIDAGDVVHATYAAFYAVNARLVHGHNLAEIVTDAHRYKQLCERFGFHEIAIGVGWVERHALALAGNAADGELDYAVEDLQLASEHDNRTSHMLFRCFEQERRYWRGDHAGVLEVSRSVHADLPCLAAREINAQFRFYACLSALELDDPSPVYLAYASELAAYGASSPTNFGHMSLLVEAERARVAGTASAVIDLHEQALDAAHEAGFTKVAIIANELAARFWLARKRPAFATLHLEAAARACTVWGAHGRAQELMLRRRAVGGASSTSTPAEVSIDFETALKASQAIASDLVLDSLLVKMVAFIGESTGAQSGALILNVHGELRVRAALREGVPSGIPGGTPISQAADVCEGIVVYTTRTGENVVLEDASRHPTFRADPYVRLRRPRSVLCLPISHNERLTGVLYLENNLVAGAFTLARLAALGLLTAQLAISVENATMVSNLESLVAERTRELTAANHRLRDEAAARESMEQELRLAQKLQSVGQLAAGIAHEINTPIQFIGDNVTFLRSGIDSMITLVEAYRHAIDPVTQSIDVAAVERAEEECDLAYVQENALSACELASTGVGRVARIVEAMKAFSHPDRVEQSYASINAGLQTTLVVAHNAYRHVADVVTELGSVPDVLCHVGELNQVFLNLIVNAADAIDDVYQRTRLRGTITIRTTHEDDMVVVEITDTGDGIPATVRERVFDPFFTTKAVGKGTGQGLALARTTIVERHGGSLAFACPPAGGTQFVIRLPIASPLAAAS